MASAQRPPGVRRTLRRAWWYAAGAGDAGDLSALIRDEPAGRWRACVLIALLAATGAVAGALYSVPTSLSFRTAPDALHRWAFAWSTGWPFVAAGAALGAVVGYFLFQQLTWREWREAWAGPRDARPLQRALVLTGVALLAPVVTVLRGHVPFALGALFFGVFVYLPAMALSELRLGRPPSETWVCYPLFALAGFALLLSLAVTFAEYPIFDWFTMPPMRWGIPYGLAAGFGNGLAAVAVCAPGDGLEYGLYCGIVMFVGTVVARSVRLGPHYGPEEWPPQHAPWVAAQARPHPVAVAAAVRACGYDVSPSAAPANDAGRQIAGLGSSDWRVRLAACEALVRLGGEAVPALFGLMGRTARSPRRFLPIDWGGAPPEERTVALARWVLVWIANDTRRALARSGRALLCTRSLNGRPCLHRCGPVVHRVAGARLRFHGCRGCNQSLDFLHWPGRVVFVLDRNQTEPWVVREGALWVAWTHGAALGDFDQVEILDATEEEARALIDAMENDSDRVRLDRYPQIPYRIVPALDAHTLRRFRERFAPG